MLKNTPNVIIIMADEHRGQAMGHMGDPNVRTPAFDRMAEQGASFTRAYCNCPVCTPSRGTIFSGRHAHSGPVSGFFDVYKPGAPSAATVFGDAGYHSAYFGKWHCGIVRDQVPETTRSGDAGSMTVSATRTPTHLRGGFVDWAGHEAVNDHRNSYIYEGENLEPTLLEGFETDDLSRRFMNYLRSYSRPEPLLAVLSVTPPHFPLDVPDGWRRHDPKELEVRPNFVEKLSMPSAHPVPDPWNSDNPMHEQTLDMRDQLARYYDLIENWDENVGKVLDTIDELDRFRGDQTIVVYLSDHGDFMGSHGLYDRKEHPHEESTRVPMIFRRPGVIPGRGCVDMQIGLVDVLPTLLGLTGLPVPTWIQGTDFSPAVLGKDFHAPTEQLLEMVNNPRWNLDFQDWRGFVDSRHKYAYYETGDEVLFDLREDPYELNNLAPTHQELCRNMRERLLRLLLENREPFFDVIIEHGQKCPVDHHNVSGVDYRIMSVHGSEPRPLNGS